MIFAELAPESLLKMSTNFDGHGTDVINTFTAVI
jgi:hypothetical protein